MTPPFLDTGFLLALEDADDQHHQDALAFWKPFRRRPQALVTTSYVFDETVTLVRMRLGHARAIEVGQRPRSSKLVNLLQIDTSDFDAAWQLFERYGDKFFSFTDCVSFAVMNRLKLRAALAFDQHFTQAGFERLPRA